MPKAQPDMTVAEAREAFIALSREIGSKCQIYPAMAHTPVGDALNAAIYPKGILDKVRIYANGNSWRELFDDCRARWAQHAELHDVSTIREMALAIIRITADVGECTDAALRAEFDATDIARCGERACDMANDMAGRGPFKIVTLSGANDQAEAA